jgi:hypothetical protein
MSSIVNIALGNAKDKLQISYVTGISMAEAPAFQFRVACNRLHEVWRAVSRSKFTRIKNTYTTPNIQKTNHVNRTFLITKHRKSAPTTTPTTHESPCILSHQIFLSIECSFFARRFDFSDDTATNSGINGY